MNPIHNNPFRILGLPVTATAKEIAKQVNTLATHAEMGKALSLETDFSFLAPVDRTSDVVDEASKRIEQSENRFFYSLFWFWNTNSVDELACELLKEGSVERAIEILEKAIFGNKKTENVQVTLFDNFEEDEYCAGINVSNKNFSNIKNLSVLFLSLIAASTGNLKQDYLRKGTALASWFFSDPHIEEYVRLVAGDRYVYEPAKAMQFYIDNAVDSLREYFPAVRLIQVFSAYPLEAKQYINTRFFARPIRNIEKEIATAQAARSGSPSSAVDVGTSLVEATKSDIEFLNAAIGESDYQYQNIADNLANEVIQCGIDFFNATQNDEPCLPLYQYGSSIAVSLRTQARAKDNLDSCIEWIADKQAAWQRVEEENRTKREREEKRREQNELEAIESRINVVLSSRASAKAKYQLLRNNVIPLLDSLEVEKGGNSRTFTQASNTLSRVIMNLARELEKVKDFSLAHEAIDLALTTCCDEELRSTITEERAVLNRDIHVVPLMELCQKAMTMAVAHPESANQSASWLLNNSRHLLSKLQEGFASTSNGADIHDEVVLAALSCHNIYGQATGNVQGCLEIAELILPFASCHAVRSKVEEQINFAHWYLEQDKSSKTTGQRSASEQYRSLQTEATGAEYSETTAENVHESSAPVQAVRYSIKYSESDGAQTLRAQITSILNAPEPPEQKFFSLVDTILPLISEISRVSGQHSAESREASDSAVSSFRDIAAELFMELRTRQLAYEALKLAADLCFDPELKKDIENERVIIEQYGAEMNLLKEDLHKISRPPVLRSFGGAGLVLAGASDFDSKGVSHLTTLYLSLFFIRLLPLARYRVIRRKDGSVTFIGKAKLRRIDQLHILLVIAMVLTLVLVFFWEV